MLAKLGYNMKRLSERINNLKPKKSDSSYVSSPDDIKNQAKKSFLNKLTDNALNLFVKHSDIKKFTKLVLSDPENLEHEKLVNDMIESGKISDVMSDKSVLDLTDNESFMKDLGL